MAKRKYQQRESGLLVANDSIELPRPEPPEPWYARRKKKPLLAGLDPEDVIPKPFASMMRPTIARMGRRCCCLLEEAPLIDCASCELLANIPVTFPALPPRGSCSRCSELGDTFILPHTLTNEGFFCGTLSPSSVYCLYQLSIDTDQFVLYLVIVGPPFFFIYAVAYISIFSPGCNTWCYTWGDRFNPGWNQCSDLTGSFHLGLAGGGSGPDVSACMPSLPPDPSQDVIVHFS